MRQRLFYIRHGETAWSRTGQHTGRTDIPLLPEGEAMARALAPWLATITFARVYSSPRERARRTCELAGLGRQAESDPEIAEWDYGEYEGLTSTEIKSRRPGWSVFNDGCPGGEMPDDIAARADRVIARLTQIDGDVALFSHGQFGSVLAARWIGAPVAMGAHLWLAAGSLSVLAPSEHHPELRLLELWNARPGAFAPPP